METKQKAKGSWGVRFFIIVLGIVLGVLLFWALTFIEQDVGNIKGPDAQKVRAEFIDKSLDEQRESLTKEINRLDDKIDTLNEQLDNLKNSTRDYQNTINQLLPIQKQSIEQGVEFPAESRQALSRVQAAFLENQSLIQDLNKQISDQTLVRQDKRAELTDLNETIQPLNEEYQKELSRLRTVHKWKVAAIKLAVLLPIFIAASVFFMKYRTGAYWPLVWAAFVASFLKVAFVARECFPKPYFRYIAILVIIAIVLRMLVYLIRMIIAPKKDLLIKQYQQYYDKYLCPVCTKPIKAGPLRYAGWKKKTTVLAPQGADLDQQQSYTCPSCGTNLYDKCGSCGKIRHTLLPYCEHCGSEKQTTDNEK
jgi:prefoldin subunit 5